MKPPVERYLRCSVDIPGGSIEMGVQCDRTGEVSRTVLRQVAHGAYMWARVQGGWDTTDELSEVLIPEMERMMSGMWPDRAWFIELWSEREALTQVYQPYGMPRYR